MSLRGKKLRREKAIMENWKVVKMNSALHLRSVNATKVYLRPQVVHHCSKDGIEIGNVLVK